MLRLTRARAVPCSKAEMRQAHAQSDARKHLVQQHRDNVDQHDRAEYRRNDDMGRVHLSPVNSR